MNHFLIGYYMSKFHIKIQNEYIKMGYPGQSFYGIIDCNKPVFNINGITFISGVNPFINSNFIHSMLYVLNHNQEQYKCFYADADYDSLIESEYSLDQLKDFFNLNEEEWYGYAINNKYGPFLDRLRNYYYMYFKALISLFNVTSDNNGEDKIIMVTCPEIFLHSTWHDKILKYIINKMNSNGYKFIVETYSDNILNALKIAIKNKEVDINKVNIYSINGTLGNNCNDDIIITKESI